MSKAFHISFSQTLSFSEADYMFIGPQFLANLLELV